jgi:molybdopterin-containing oxidoreductase family membrane subunit
MFYPTIWDMSTYIGTIGLFFALMFLFIRFLPVISIFEMRELVSQTSDDDHGGDGRSAGHSATDASHPSQTPS